MTGALTFAGAPRRHAAVRGSSLAVVDGAVRWSWCELDERARGVASGLREAGAEPGSRVAILARPAAVTVAALHGIARAGAVAAPVGARLTPGELGAAVAAVDPVLVVHDEDRIADAAALGRPTLALADLLVADGRSRGQGTTERGRTTERGLATERADMDEDAPAAVVLTSGTTGRPRAIVLSGAAMRASAEAWMAVLPPATGWLLALGLDHVAGLGVTWRAALAGVPLVIVDGSDPAAILAALTGEPVPSHVSLVPTQLVRLLDLADAAGMVAPATLRAVLLGGGPIPAPLVERALAGRWPVVPTYGLSEAGSAVTALPTSDAVAHPGSAGRPLPGVEIRIEDADQDGVGEIVVRTPARFSGYLGEPDATAAALTSMGWLRTGDLGRLDRGGYLTVVDRRTDRIVRGGENIAPSEVEAVLLAHPAIEDVGVVACADETWGHVPMAAIVLRTGAPDPGDGVLVAHCRARLARSRVPVAFVRFAALPRTVGGKLRRAELRAWLEHEGVAPP